MIRDARGTVAIIFALLLPVLVGFIGLTLDLGRGMVAAGHAQEIVDRLAMTAGREFITNRSKGDSWPESVVRNMWTLDKPKGVGSALFFLSGPCGGSWCYRVNVTLAVPLRFISIIPGVPMVWTLERGATVQFNK